MIASEYCSVLHRRSDDDFIDCFIASSLDRSRSRVAPQPELGLLPVRYDWAHSDYSYHHDGARPVLKERMGVVKHG